MVPQAGQKPEIRQRRPEGLRPRHAIAHKKTAPERGYENMEAEVGIEPAYADLQSAA
jgi:hypothetical protein